MGELRQELASADDVEAELRVEEPGPVVFEGFEEHDVVLAARLVERVLDDRATEAAAAEGVHRFDVFDLGGAAVAA